jgi:hypothetical protein
MEIKWLGALTVLFGLIVLIAPWVTTGATLNYLETIMGILVIIAGAMGLK